MRFDLNKLIRYSDKTADGRSFNTLDVLAGRVRGVVNAQGEVEYRRWQRSKRLKRVLNGARPLCGAKCRTGQPCQRKAVAGKRRCPNHGGLSTGPKTAEGRARIVESNRRRAAKTS